MIIAHFRSHRQKTRGHWWVFDSNKLECWAIIIKINSHVFKTSFENFLTILFNHLKAVILAVILSDWCPVILPNLKIQIITGARNSTTIFGQSQRDTTNEKTTISGITSQYFFKTRSGMEKYNLWEYTMVKRRGNRAG